MCMHVITLQRILLESVCRWCNKASLWGTGSKGLLCFGMCVKRVSEWWLPHCWLVLTVYAFVCPSEKKPNTFPVPLMLSSVFNCTRAWLLLTTSWIILYICSWPTVLHSLFVEDVFWASCCHTGRPIMECARVSGTVPRHDHTEIIHTNSFLLICKDHNCKSVSVLFPPAICSRPQTFSTAWYEIRLCVLPI